jgi:hypothetical protein
MTREWEWRQHLKAVTDWEYRRYFEIIWVRPPNTNSKIESLNAVNIFVNLKHE